MTELQALTNATKSVHVDNLNVYERTPDDKRKTVKKYYLCLNGATISPTLDYDNMTHFILGFSKATQLKKSI